MDLRTLTPHIGAEILDVGLSKPLNNEEFATIHQVHLDHRVLVLRDQHLNREQHKAFATKFGVLHVHPLNKQCDGESEILQIKTTANPAYTAGGGWHTDVTCDESPPMGSMLYITEVPECGGGDTLCADMYHEYELLSGTMNVMLDGLVAVHDGALPYFGNYKIQPAEGQCPAQGASCHRQPPRDGQEITLRQRRLHESHQGAKPCRESGLARHAVPAYRFDATPDVSGAMATQYADIFEQSLCSASCDLGLPSPQPLC